MSSDREIPARRQPQATREPASPWEHDPFDLLDPGEPRASSEPLLPGAQRQGEHPQGPRGWGCNRKNPERSRQRNQRCSGQHGPCKEVLLINERCNTPLKLKPGDQAGVSPRADPAALGRLCQLLGQRAGPVLPVPLTAPWGANIMQDPRDSRGRRREVLPAPGRLQHRCHGDAAPCWQRMQTPPVPAF